MDQEQKWNINARWATIFDERELKEIALSQVYASDFHHGTVGHNQHMLIAKMANILTQQELENNYLRSLVPGKDADTGEE